MNLRRCILVASLAVLLPFVAAGAETWERLKLGMTTDEASSVLGEPLIRNEGNGFTLWIYDNGSEVVFYGGVIAWTAPADRFAVRYAVERWQFFQAAPGQVRDPRPSKAVFLPVPKMVAQAKPDKTAAFRYWHRL